MNYYSNDRDRLVRIFGDTLSMCKNDEQLKQSIEESISGSVLYVENDNPKLARPKYADTTISVNQSISIGHWKQRSITRRNILMRR